MSNICPLVVVATYVVLAFIERLCVFATVKGVKREVICKRFPDPKRQYP